MLYVVCEYYTNVFYGLFINEKDAKKRSEECGGYVLTYNLAEKIVIDDYGELVERGRSIDNA